MARGDVTATIHIEGLGAFRRDLKRISPLAEQQLRRDLQGIAQKVASTAQTRVAPSSFSYRGNTTTALRAKVQSQGPKGYVARFIEFGFHPRGGTTFVPGRNEVGRALESREADAVREIGDAIERAATKAGWH